MARRLLLIIVALVVALFGAGAVLTYAGRADSRAVAAEQTTNVLMASADVPAGTPVGTAESKGLIRAGKIPTRLVPPGALDALGTVIGQVVSEDIHSGEVVLRAQFVASQLAGSIKIPDGLLAISVTVQDPQRVGGFVLPGSFVAVFDTFPVQKPNATPGDAVVDSATRMLLPRAKVIAVGLTALQTIGGETKSKPSSGGLGNAAQDASATLTLAVDSTQALKLVHAAQTGRLYFALLSDKSKSDVARSVDNSTLFQ